MRKQTIIKLIILVILIILCIGLSFGCSKDDNIASTETLPENTYLIYYVNKSETKLVTEQCVIEETNTGKLIQALIGKMGESVDDVEYKSVFPDSTNAVRNRYLEGEDFVSILFDHSYDDLTSSQQYLCWTAIVNTLDQIPGINSVSFYYNSGSNTTNGLGEVLTDKNGDELLNMKSTDIMDTLGISAMSIEEKTVTLYFTDESGTQLIKEEQTITYNNNMSLEKLIVNQLIKGPISDNAYATLPSETKVIYVTVKQGVCYVNFDSTFINSALDIGEEIPIYSIVNSLTELETVDKVNISVDGDTGELNFERNLDLVREDETD